MRDTLGRIMPIIAYIIAAIAVIIGIVVSIQLNNSIMQFNKAIDVELTGLSSLDEDLPEKKSKAWTWLPFLSGITIGIILTGFRLIGDYMNTIKTMISEYYETTS